MELSINPNPSYLEAAIVGDRCQAEEKVLEDAIGFSPADICLEGIKTSAYVGTINTDDGEPIALVGIVDHAVEEGTGVLWSMSTNEVKKCPIAFIKVMRKLMDEYGGLYDKLITLALADNPQHLRFPVALGMTPSGQVVSVPETSISYNVYEMVTTKGLNKIYYEQS
jgi:hypothetical protein|tara:strand:+ start:2394 stop:2894 length:501 start_codon:yes stop_codon:yes gene_type:complete